jgi:signal transduction histidine kinase
MSSGSDSGERPRDPAPSGRLSEAVGLGPASRTVRLAFFELGPDDACVLQGLRETAESSVDGIVSRFYDHLLRFPELEALLRAEPGRVERLKGIQRAYFLTLTEGRFDDAYFESRLRVGDAHQRAGLEPSWYIGAFALYLRLAMRALIPPSGDGARLLPALEALVKAVCLDMSLAIDTYIYGGFVDRAAAKRLDDARRVAEDALRVHGEVERLKDDLTSMVVHDLKNPVNGIAMMVQLALRKGRDLPGPLRNHLLHIDRTCREMMRLIQNLLEISKIEEGKMPTAREPIVLADVVDEVAREYGPVAEQSGRQLRVAVPTELPPAAADRALVKRVLVNLVVNAVRHSGSHEVRVEGAAGPGPREVSFRVVDHGHGIPPGEQARLFEKFRTVRRSPSDDPTSDTGLGLPFCRLAVEHMGGRIALASTPETGTVFTVTLPAHAPCSG